MDTHDSILIVAGEASADLHGALVLEELRQKAPQLQFFGIGGAGMRKAGLEALVQAEDMSVAGLTEVLLALPRIFGYMRRVVREAAARKPKVAVLIDMPDFNLRLAKRLKAMGIPVVYYISPQLWAWRQGRVKQVRALVDRMLVILPFEQKFYEQHGVPAEFVGHPLVEELAEIPDKQRARAQLEIQDGSSPVIALLPGSRRKELSRHLPAMLQAVDLLRAEHPKLTALLPVASTIPVAMVEQLVERSGAPVRIVQGQSTEVLSAADLAVVCSGTATLQTALLLRPMVVVYRVSWLSYQILKRLVKVAHIALVNLIAGKALVPELIQGSFTPKNLAAELHRLLTDRDRQQELAQEFARIRQNLGENRAATRVAHVVTTYLPQKSPPS